MLRVALVSLLACGCGRVGFGQLAATAGDGNGDDGVGPPSAFTHVFAYGDQTCALTVDHAYCWGRNDDGQLGNSNGNAASPVELTLPSTAAIDAISQGDKHGCAIAGGEVYCFGNSFGAPTHIPLASKAKGVAAGRDFTCVLDDAVRCFGNNDVGQLGDSTTNPHNRPMPIDSGRVFEAISAGDDHACAVSPTSGDAKCWGHNDNGTLGYDNASDDHNATPQVVIGVATLPQIAGWHACTLDAGQVSCWGRNNEGELGDGGNMDAAKPQLVPGLADVTALAVGGGPTDLDATCAITGGNVHCWGAGLFGRLGNGAVVEAQRRPVGVSLAGPAVEVAIGYDHACALLANGEIWCWGRGDTGQLGDGNAADSLVPVRVRAPG